MNVLVINSGSSSVKADVIDTLTQTKALSVRVQRVGTAEIAMTVDGNASDAPAGSDHEAAVSAILGVVASQGHVASLAAVGHRVVHGGDRFSAPTRIDDDVARTIEALCELAPLHNPANLAGIVAARAALPDIPHVAVFDTAFHATLPRRAKAYAIPTALADKHGLRRYGFHGTSHAYVARAAAEFLEQPVEQLRLITCHLGNGCSVTAVEYGRSVETSMGMTPLEGLVMGTRAGDLDAGLLLEVMRREGWSTDDADRVLNRESGLAGLSGVGNDMRDIEARAGEGDEQAQLAIHVFTHRLRKYIGAYAAVMGGVDAVVFTGGIGQNSALVRSRVVGRLDFIGIRLDEEANRAGRADSQTPVVALSQAHSRVAVLAVATDEEAEIARQAASIAAAEDQVSQPTSIPIAVSARHCHLTDEAVEILFGKGHTLTPKKAVTQPGQYAAEECVQLIGPKRTIEKCRVVGPTRSRCQVEISRTDEFFLGMDAPVRGSGDLDGTPGITLVGPAGSLVIQEGVICSQRHIHMTPADAEQFGVKHKDVVEVAIDTKGRDIIFGDVLVRVKDSYALEMHLDTDEANAAELSREGAGVIVKTDAMVTLRRRNL